MQTRGTVSCELAAVEALCVRLGDTLVMHGSETPRNRLNGRYADVLNLEEA